MGLFDFLKKKNNATDHRHGLTISAETKTANSKKVLSKVSLENYCSPAGGYLNYAEFFVVGYVINPETGRKNICKKKIYAKNEELACETIKNSGMVEIKEITMSELELPTDRQLNYANDLGAVLPDGAGKWDVSAIISRLEEYQPSPNEELAMFADTMGICFSKYIGADILFERICAELSDRDVAAFYAYSMKMAEKGAIIKNMLNDASINYYYRFADYALANPVIIKSIRNQHWRDFQIPNKRTKAYQQLKSFQ